MGTVNGIVKVGVKDLSSLLPGRIKFKVIGAAGTYPVDPSALPVTASISVEGPVGVDNQCGEVAFSGPAPVPECKLVQGGDTLRCK